MKAHNPQGRHATLLFAHLKPGDHAVFQPDLYGGTFQLARELARFGVRDGLIRVSVGIEGIEDLLEDVAQALDGIGCG